MKRFVFLAFLALIIAFAGCAGGTRNPVTTTAQQGNTTINLGDATNDQIIEFEVTVTAVTLSGGSNPSVLPKPTDVEFVHNAGTVEPLSLLNVPNGAYTGATISLSNPEVVIIDPATKLPKKLTATLTSSNVTVPFGPSLTIGGTATVINFDLNLANSITIDATNTSATVSPQFTATTSAVPAANNDNEDNEHGELEDVRGTITDVSSPKFTIQPAQTANPVTFTTDSNTQFKDGITSFSGLTKGMIVSVDAVTQSDGAMLAKKVESETETANGEEVEGVITAVTCPVATACPGTGNAATKITITTQKSSATGTAANTPTHGNSVDISIGSGTKFAVRSRKLVGPFPAFDSTHIGKAQRVEADSENESSNTSSSVVGDKIKLSEQALVGTVSALSGNTFTLTVGSSSAFASLTGGATVTVQTQSGTEIRNVTVANGNTVRVRGLLFVNGTTYTLLAARIVQP